MITRRFVLAAGFVCLIAAPAGAENGAIPVWEPTTIAHPGHYILVRNIGGADAYNVITIAADNVDLDLNGFTITCSMFAIRASGVRGLDVHDGFLHCSGNTVQWSGLENFSLRRVVAVTDYGEMGIEIDNSTHGVVQGNKVRMSGDDALWVTGRAIAIRENEFSGDVQVYSSGCEVSGNLVDNGKIYVAASGNAVLDNVIRGTWGSDGLIVSASDNSVARNTISGRGGNGISVRGSNNQVMENTLNSNAGFGLVFSDTASGNVYRGNIARGNSGATCPIENTDFCDFGTHNTSHGDNYMPERQ